MSVKGAKDALTHPLTMYATAKQNLLEMFMDRTAGESTLQNRLVTRETDAGNVALIAYGWLKVAEYDEERGVVTVFAGHKSLNSQTVNKYLNDVVRMAEERSRDVVLTGESPTVDTPNAGVQFIDNYVGNFANMSPVDRDAKAVVVDSLANVA